MATRQSEPSRESRPPASAEPSHPGHETRAEDRSPLTDLINDNREALRRISLLEMHFNGLREGLTASPPNDGSHSPSATRQDQWLDSTGILSRIQALETASLQARIDALENRMAGPTREEQYHEAGQKPSAVPQQPHNNPGTTRSSRPRRPS